MFIRRKNKYGAKRTADGFPSKLEAAVYQLLKFREKAGKISDIRRQHSVELLPGVNWRVDFSFLNCEVDPPRREFAEAKGVETEPYRIKAAIWRQIGPSSLEIWKGSYDKLRLTEIIKPQETHDDCPGCKNTEGCRGKGHHVG